MTMHIEQRGETERLTRPHGILCIGDAVTYQTGSGVQFDATVTGFGWEDGDMVIDVRLADGRERWGYRHQVWKRVPAGD